MQFINKSKNDHDVDNFVFFMKNHFKKKDDTDKPITHTLLGPLHEAYANYRGAFCIEGMDYQKFVELYKKAIPKMNMHIVERQCEVGPMLIDIDFKLDKTYKDRQYLDEHIEYIVQMYISNFEKYLNICKEDIKAFVFEKPEPTYDVKNKVYKDGFHAVFPFVPLDVKKRYFFFDRIKKIIFTAPKVQSNKSSHCIN